MHLAVDQETGHDILHHPVRTAVGEGDIGHLVAVELVPVPAAALTDKGTVREGVGHRCATGEDQTQGRHVAGQRIIWRDRRFHQIGARRAYAGVHVVAVIAVGPAIERVFLDRGHVVWHQVRPQFVTFVDDRPQRAAVGVEGQAVRVAQPRGIDLGRPRLAVDLPDGGTALFGLHPVLGGVRVRADRRVQHRPIRAKRQVLGPVVVQRTARQRRDRRGFGIDHRVAQGIGIGDDRIGGGDIQRVVDPGQAEGRMQPGQQVVAFVHRAVAVGVAQQRDQVAFRWWGVTAARRKGHDPAADEILGAVFRLTLRRARLDHQHVTVGQRMDGARIDQVGGIGADRQPLGDGRRLAVGPAHDLGHVHARQRIDEFRFGQDRIGTDLAGNVEPFGILRGGAHRQG